MDPQGYQPYLDKLIAWATGDLHKEDLLGAKADYFQRTGEVHEDDKSFEMRMASFLDWYLYDRLRQDQKTPAQAFLEACAGEGMPTSELAIFRGFTETRHGLFEVRKIKKGTLRLRDLCTGKDHQVTERRQVAGLEKGDVIEARLIPFDGHLLFSAAFLYHPREAFKPLSKEIKRRRKKEPQRDPKEIVFDAARMALKVERYRQIAVEKIYDFEQRKI